MLQYLIKFKVPILLIIIGLFCYFLGGSHCETKVIQEYVEVRVEHDTRKDEIYNRPHAGRDELLKRMFANKL